MNRFSEEWLAYIAHLPLREQNRAKARSATKKDEAEEARMTPEMREADRLDAEIVGEIQQKVNARMAAKAAAKDAAKGSGSKWRMDGLYACLTRCTTSSVTASNGSTTFTVYHLATSRVHANFEAQKAATTPLTSSTFDTQKPAQSRPPFSTNQPTQPHHHGYYFVRQL